MRFVTLEYHDVVAESDFDASGFPGPAAASYKMDRVRFAAHLAAIRSAGVSCGATAGDDPLASTARTTVLFTFDDGGASAATITAPLLETFGWRGHFLVTTDRIGAPGFLDHEQIRELHRRGHIVGSHSASHPVRMARCSGDQMREEWRRSLRVLSETLGVPVRVASVPGGYYSAAVATAAAAEGVRVLFTSEPSTSVWRVGDCRVMGRFILRRRTSAATARRLVEPMPAARATQWAAWNLKRISKALAGDTYLQIRRLAFRDIHAGGGSPLASRDRD